MVVMIMKMIYGHDDDVMIMTVIMIMKMIYDYDEEEEETGL
jgi:hypothetical protein